MTFKNADGSDISGTVESGTSIYALISPDDLGSVFYYGQSGWFYMPTKCEFGVVDGVFDPDSPDNPTWYKKVTMFDRSGSVFWPGNAALRDYIWFFTSFVDSSKSWMISFNSFVFADFTGDVYYSMRCELELCLGSNPVECQGWKDEIESGISGVIRNSNALPSIWDFTNVGLN